MRTTKMTYVWIPKSPQPIVEELELSENRISETPYFSFTRSTETGNVVFSPSKNEDSLFDQVLARYQEELKKLVSDTDFKPLYIGIRQAGDEIHVWALINGNDCHTLDALSDLEMNVNSDLIPPDMELLTFFDYSQRIPPNGYYRQLYPIY